MLYCKRAHPIMRLFCFDCRNAKVEGACGCCKACLTPVPDADDKPYCPKNGKDCFEPWFDDHYKLYLVNGIPIGIVPKHGSTARADLTKSTRRAKVASP